MQRFQMFGPEKSLAEVWRYDRPSYVTAIVYYPGESAKDVILRSKLLSGRKIMASAGIVAGEITSVKVTEGKNEAILTAEVKMTQDHLGLPSQTIMRAVPRKEK